MIWGRSGMNVCAPFGPARNPRLLLGVQVKLILSPDDAMHEKSENRHSETGFLHVIC